MYSYVYYIIFHCGQEMETTEVSFNRWLNKEGGVHVYNGIATRKDIILPFMTTWMGLENIMLNEIGQTEKEPYDFTHMG